MPERRTVPRRKFDYYMRVLDDDTGTLLGHLIEISPQGLKLETTKPLPLQQDYYLRLELTPDLGDRPYMVFIAKSRWCKSDEIQINLYRVGFEITEIMPDDQEIFMRIVAKYGS